jgi:large subunit ribosomal protein L24
MHLKKGDTVVVLSGRSQDQGGDRGKTGEVTKVLPKEGKAIVQGVNVRTRHSKPSMTNPQGGRIQSEMPVEASRLMVVCPACSKPTRVKKVQVEGRNTRACRRCNEQLPETKEG